MVIPNEKWASVQPPGPPQGLAAGALPPILRPGRLPIDNEREIAMSYNATVKITVKVDGEKVATRKVEASVASVEQGRALLTETHAAADDIASELAGHLGVTV